MHILYVTPLWSGLGDALANPNGDARGMPAFLEVLTRLCESGHRVDLAVIVSAAERRALTAPRWLTGRLMIHRIRAGGRISRAASYLGIVNSLRREVMASAPDIVYCHGGVGALGAIAARLAGARHAVRLYGTFLAQRTQAGERWRIALSDPMEWYVLRNPGQFLIITNDGTRGDLVADAIARTAVLGHHYLLNGVEPIPPREPLRGESLRADAQWTLIYPARFHRWKGQHRAIELLKLLREAGVDCRLEMLGHVSDVSYREELEAHARSLHVGDCVAIGQPVARRELIERFADERTIALSLYDVSNLGNVAIEALSAGAILVTLRDGTLSALSGASDAMVAVDDVAEATARLVELTKDADAARRLRRSAREFAAKTFVSWDQRFRVEEELLLRAVTTK